MFWAPCGSGGGGWVDEGGGWLGVPPTQMHTHTCTHTHTHMVNMIISCKWPPPLGEYLGIPYDVICTCVHVCVHISGVHPPTTPLPIQGCTLPPPPTPPPLSTYPPMGGTSGISQNSIALELIEIFQFCLKI